MRKAFDRFTYRGGRDTRSERRLDGAPGTRACLVLRDLCHWSVGGVPARLTPQVCLMGSGRWILGYERRRYYSHPRLRSLGADGKLFLMCLQAFPAPGGGVWGAPGEERRGRAGPLLPCVRAPGQAE